jgi:putative transposase
MQLAKFQPREAAHAAVIALTPKSGAEPGAAVVRMLAAALAVEDQRLIGRRESPAGLAPTIEPLGNAALPQGRVPIGLQVTKRRVTETPAAAIVQLHWRRRSSLEQTMLALYYGNLSPYQAEEAARLLWGDSLNGAVVSACVETVRERIQAWLRQPVAEKYAYVFLGAVRIKQRIAGQSREAWVRCAVGMDNSGRREMLGLHAEPAEGLGANWSGLLRDLKKRGLREADLFVGDLDDEQAQAIGREFPSARRQVCVFQLEREVLASVPNPQLHVAMELCGAIQADTKSAISRERLLGVVKEFRKHGLKVAAALLERVHPEAVSYGTFPRAHWRQIRTNDAVKRMLSPFRERIRVIGPIAEPEALTLLAAAHLREIERVVWDRRRAPKG